MGALAGGRLNEAGTLDPALCNEKVRDLQIRLKALKAQRVDLEAKRKSLELPALDQAFVASLLEDFERLLEAGTKEQRTDEIQPVRSAWKDAEVTNEGPVDGFDFVTVRDPDTGTLEYFMVKLGTDSYFVKPITPLGKGSFKVGPDVVEWLPAPRVREGGTASLPPGRRPSRASTVSDDVSPWTRNLPSDPRGDPGD